jgi:glutamate dehydrogenase
MDADLRTAQPFSFGDFAEAARTGPYPGFQRGDVLTPEAHSFLSQIHRDSHADDIDGLAPADLLAIAYAFWMTAQTRPGAERRIRVAPAIGADGLSLDRDMLEIVGPDMPFLVDSVMGELADRKISVRAMFHPIVTATRDAAGRRTDHGAPERESYIQVHFDPLPPDRREALITGVNQTLGDVTLAVTDYHAMRDRMVEATRELAGARTSAAVDEVEEAIAFLDWLAQDHFAFLGAREYDYPRTADGQWERDEPVILQETGLGILRDPERFVLRRASEPLILTASAKAFIDEPSPIIVGKSNISSRVHRRVRCDYVGVKRYNRQGEVIGETRFIGLFTADAYTQMTRDIPLLRRKTRRVLERAAQAPGSHNAKSLTNIVENYPRDELFQIDEDDLLRISLGVMHLFDRPRTRLFVRMDRFERFASALVFVPRDRYNSALRERVGEVIANAFAGRVSAFYPQFGDAPLARVLYIIGLDRGRSRQPDLGALEAEIVRLARTWQDDLERRFLAAHEPGPEAQELSARWRDAFTAAYREAFEPEEALRDAAELQSFAPAQEVRVRAYRPSGDPDTALRCKVYCSGEPLPLSAVVPIFENMGLFVQSEFAYPARPAQSGAPTFYIHDVRMRAADGAPIDFTAVESSFEEAFAAVWTGRTENDAFNALILKPGMTWREAALIRALCKFRQQSGMDPSQTVQQQALGEHPGLVCGMLDLFRARFDPGGAASLDDRRARQCDIAAHLETALSRVTTLDADRVLRRLVALICAIQRTNFYQTTAAGEPAGHISFKVASRELADLPLPKPFREIFVWAPEVEGVHLRFGPVARGGLRWSDRRDDFRTEVLGLVKAQQVKNAVIVPVGSKGGFFAKQSPRGGARAQIQAEGARAYRTFLRGLLDITDNLDGETVVRPRDVVVWDGEDPYLVVAADKGTATFSDAANAVAAEYGFWLGDAFASGGGKGYDHKKMGITARGAWEAVKRHFREMGRDTQSEPFTVIGIGDMSGDVFGNGMLLSDKIRLIAAFDHRDIFFDPDPDETASFAERRRLFSLERSSWQEYDRTRLSEGGGVFSRGDKAIVLSPALKALTGLTQDTASPEEVMRMLLQAPCDLLWFGGIGTYIKAGRESHADVSDKANDAIRVDAGQVRAKVIGEGANLGVTQAGRIELDRRGVRLNTDAIDNSAGVDTSDHEVNVKVLLNEAMRARTLTLQERDALLDSMTPDIARLVLRDNYLQTKALTVAKAGAAADLDDHERFMERLEAGARLNRKVESLPAADEIRALRAQNAGLSRPELAVLLAYAKLELFDELIGDTQIDDAYFRQMLSDYFPPALASRGPEMDRHRLRREIIATALANDIVNVGGPLFIQRAAEGGGLAQGEAAAGYALARAIFRTPELIARIDALDLKAPAELQTALHQEVVCLLQRQTAWLAWRVRLRKIGLGAGIELWRPGIDELRTLIPRLLAPSEAERVERRVKDYASRGAPADLARDIALLTPMTCALDVLDLAARRGWALEPAARIFFANGELLAFDALRVGAEEIRPQLHWDRLAVRRLTEEFFSHQAEICDAAMAWAESVARSPGAGVIPDARWAHDVVAAWRRTRGAAAEAAAAALADMAASGGWSLGKLAMASAHLRELAQGRAAL